MGKNKRKRNNRFLLLLFCLLLAIFAGWKSGQYMAQKKPIIENTDSLKGIKGGGGNSSNLILPENELVNITSFIYEFINAENKINSERLSILVDSGYYNTLLKNLRTITPGEVSNQNLDYKEIGTDKVTIEVTYLKSNKQIKENIFLKKENELWKVTKVEKISN